MHQSAFFIVLFCTICFQSFAQIGGNSTYEFLRLPASARATALGGTYLGQFETDIALANHNPASLNAKMHQRVTFNQSIHLAGTTNGYLGYGHHTDKFERPWTFQEDCSICVMEPSIILTFMETQQVQQVSLTML